MLFILNIFIVKMIEQYFALGCWITISHTFLHVRSPTSWIGHQHLKLVTNTFGLQRPSPTSMLPAMFHAKSLCCQLKKYLFISFLDLWSFSGKRVKSGNSYLSFHFEKYHRLYAYFKMSWNWSLYIKIRAVMLEIKENI